MTQDQKIILIAHRISRAKSAIELGLSNVRLFDHAGAKDLRPHARRLGLRRARLGMLLYAMKTECRA